MTTPSKVFAFKLAEKKPVRKWQVREGVSVAGCTHVGGGIYWSGPMYMPDGQYEC